MTGNVDLTWGGVLGGALIGELRLQDGSKWHFQGGYGSIVSPVGAGYSRGIDGDFPGTDHLAGQCAFEVTAGGLGPSGIHFDLHGRIGTAAGQAFGGGILVGIGGGTWTQY